MSEREYPEPDPTLSSDARFSTYEKAPDDDPDEYPPRGGGVIQTKGKPRETPTTTRRTAKTTTKET